MDPIDREIMVLRHFKELTHGESALPIGIQESAGSKWYLRALSLE